VLADPAPGRSEVLPPLTAVTPVIKPAAARPRPHRRRPREEDASAEETGPGFQPPEGTLQEQLDALLRGARRPGLPAAADRPSPSGGDDSDDDGE
jgi:hypothetical protein